MTEDVSSALRPDTTLGVAYPAWAFIIVDGHTFEATEPDDWRQALVIASMTGGTIAIPAGGAPGPAWCAAARRFAAMVRCSCGQHNLDPGHPDALGLHLCPGCYEQASCENAHSDFDHDNDPDPDCPICVAATGGDG